MVLLVVFGFKTICGCHVVAIISTMDVCLEVVTCSGGLQHSWVFVTGLQPACLHAMLCYA